MTAEQITHDRELDLKCAAAWQRSAATHYAVADKLRASGFFHSAELRQRVAREAYEHSARILATTLSIDAKFAALRAAL